MAGLEALVASRALNSIGGEIVLFDTGAGFKSQSPPVPRPAVIPNDEAFWREKVLPSLGRAT